MSDFFFQRWFFCQARISSWTIICLALGTSSVAARTGPPEDDQTAVPARGAGKADGHSDDGGGVPLAAPSETEPGIPSREVKLGLSSEALRVDWGKRLEALERGEADRARNILEALVLRKEDSGWPNAVSQGLALSVEAYDKILDNHPDDAERLVHAALRLAPDEPRIHAVKARVHWANGEVLSAAGAAFSAVRGRFRDPWCRRLHLVNLGLGVLFSMLTASALFAVASIYRHFDSLRRAASRVLPKGVWRAQATLIVFLVLLAPMAAGVGGVGTIFVWSIVGAGFCRARERVASVLVTVFLGILPFLLSYAVAPLSYTDSRAHDAYRAATDIGAGASAARLAGSVDVGSDEQLILGLRALWSGDLDQAAQWLYRAMQRDKSTPELYIGLGNTEFLRGRIDEATRFYRQAITSDPANPIALFNLARLEFFKTDEHHARKLYRQASQRDHLTVERWAAGVERVGPSFVVAPSVPDHILQRGASHRPTSQQASMEIWTALAGGVDPRLFALIVVAGWVGIFTIGRLKPGVWAPHPVEAQPLERIRDEIRAHRRRARRVRLQRIVSLVCAGAGQLLGGRSLVGLVLATGFVAGLVFAGAALGLVPTVTPYDGETKVLGLAIALAIAAVCYTLSLWKQAREDT